MFGIKRHKPYISKEGYKHKYKPKSPEATGMQQSIVMSQAGRLVDLCAPMK